MSKYHQQLIDYIDENPDFIQPKGKRSEVVGFLKKPLGDLCISRPKSRISWGIELPFDSEFVTYVWFDALLNYASALGYKRDDTENFDSYWPVATHLIGKDILTTHSVYWPTMLMALGVSLPKCIFAHGWWLTDNDKKMSKSEGPVVSPLDVKDIVGVYGLRYYLMRAMNPANDGQFSVDLVLTRVNTELANNLGNLLNRTTGLVTKYFDSVVPPLTNNIAETAQLQECAARCAADVRSHIEAIAPNRAMESVLELLSETNKYLDQQEPWKTAKTDLAAAGECLRAALEVLRVVGILLTPVMPDKMPELLSRVGYTATPVYSDALIWPGLSDTATVVKGDALFPRVEYKPEG